MLNELNQEQISLMQVVRDEWKSNLALPLNKPKAIEGIYWLYDFCGLKRPDILFVESPLGCQYAANLIKALISTPPSPPHPLTANVGDNVGANVRDNVGDENERLHSDDKPAITWNDGYEVFYWHGIAVPREWILQPQLITKQTIMVEQNAEKRRCLMEIIGSERYAILLDIEELDSDTDQHGNLMVLYKTKEVDPLAEGYIFFAKVVCPSTQRVYFLCIPPDIDGATNNVWQAVAWTFGKKKSEYAPLIET